MKIIKIKDELEARFNGKITAEEYYLFKELEKI